MSPAVSPIASSASPVSSWRRALTPRRWLALVGPGALVAVGYVDPGNWATDLAAGSRAGYALLAVVLLSSALAVLVQVMSARLGLATGRDLAEASREAWPRLAVPSWIAAELAIVATDLAEVLGSALALELLFHIPLAAGVILTAADVLVLLALDRRGRASPALEAIVFALTALVACAFVYELALARPPLAAILDGCVPRARLATDPSLLFLGVGIVGATVMPHNLYLHSSLVQRRWPALDPPRAARAATADTVRSLAIAMLLNGALVVLAASVFHARGRTDVTDLRDAHQLLAPLLGTQAASVVFAAALLAAGQSATITGTLAGQVVMTGYLRLRIAPWARRLVTRALALVPALAAIAWAGEAGVAPLLLASQVVLSLQLPFALVPLVALSANGRRMGPLVAPRWMTALAWLGAAAIVAANGALLVSLAR